MVEDNKLFEDVTIADKVAHKYTHIPYFALFLSNSSQKQHKSSMHFDLLWPNSILTELFEKKAEDGF